MELVCIGIQNVCSRIRLTGWSLSEPLLLSQELFLGTVSGVVSEAVVSCAVTGVVSGVLLAVVSVVSALSSINWLSPVT